MKYRKMSHKNSLVRKVSWMLNSIIKKWKPKGECRGENKELHLAIKIMTNIMGILCETWKNRKHSIVSFFWHKNMMH